jgi:hypothetical protein
MEVSGQLHAPAVLLPGRNLRTHGRRGCVGPRAGAGVLDKKKIRIPDRLGCRLVTVPAAPLE